MISIDESKLYIALDGSMGYQHIFFKIVQLFMFNIW